MATVIRADPGCRGMAGPTDPKLNVKRAEEDPKQAEKMRLLKELAKMAKPVKDSKGMKE